MTVTSALNIVRTYPFFDIDNLSGDTIRKQLSVDLVDENIIASYVRNHNGIKLVPKKMIGASPSRLINEAIQINVNDIDVAPAVPLNGFGGLPVQSGGYSSPSNDMYKILYENAREEAREYKRKYEDAISDKHKAELDLAGTKNNVWGDVAAGLGSVLMGGGLGGNLSGAKAIGVGNTPQVPQAIADKRLSAITMYYNKLTNEEKTKVYQLLAKVFTDVAVIDELMEYFNEE